MRRVLGRLLLLLGGLVMGVLIAELGLRLWAGAGAGLFGTPQDIPPEAFRGDDQLYQVPVPGWSGQVRGLEYEATLRFDEDGLRAGSPEGSREGGRRVLLLGDSFALGAQVEEAQTAAGQLAVLSGDAVLNAGVDGYSTWQADLRLVRLAPVVHPQAVVLLFFLGNDLADNERFPQLQGSRYAPHGEAGLRERLARSSWLLASVSSRWIAWQIARGAPEQQRYARELAPFTRAGRAVLDEQMTSTKAALARLSARCDTFGLPLLVVTAPPAFAVDESRAAATLRVAGLDPAEADLDAPARALDEALEEIGVARCDLSAPFRRAAAEGAQLYFRFDGHWTTAGHALAAQEIWACIQSKGLSTQK